ncbi:MAG: alpha/beta fold hydrolase [Dermatophilaceae bacterium]
MSRPFSSLLKTSRALLETSNILLTTSEAKIGTTPRDVVWTHRKATLYRYRSSNRQHDVPILLVFALINRPMIYDLQPGNSFVEFLLKRGFDVFLLDWGVPQDEDSDMGLEEYVCDQLAWAVRETLRESGQKDVSMIGWCMGAVLAAMYAAITDDCPARNLVLLTMPVDTTETLYAHWLNRDSFDVDHITQSMPLLPGGYVDWANRMMKPVTNYVTTYRKLYESVAAGKINRSTWQAMNKWVADNPPFPSKAFQQWVQWLFKENQLVRNRVILRGRRVDLANITQSTLVVTAGADHIAPRVGTLPLLDLVSSDDVTHFDRAGGHIGLMAGSKARREVWPDIADWLAERSD